MEIAVVLLAILIFCFGFVIFFGAPYLPTMSKQVEAAMALADLKPGQTVIELGCGDGRVMAAFASRGIKAIGYEINPVLYLICKLRLRKYKGTTTVVFGNFWSKDWPEANAVFTFLLDKYMPKLDHRLREYNPKPIKLISYAFKIPDAKPTKTKNGVYLYIYR